MSSGELALVEADDRLGHGVVVGVAAGADGGDGAFGGEAFGVADREVLHATVGVMDQPGEGLGAAPDGHLQGVQGQVGAQRGGDAPAEDAPRVQVGDERRLLEGRRHIGLRRAPQRREQLVTDGQRDDEPLAVIV